MNLLEAIQTRQSIRQFNQENVDQSLIIELLQQATLAPTHQHRESWRFILVAGKSKEKLVKRIPKLYDLVDPFMGTRIKNIELAQGLVVIVVPRSEDQKYQHEEIGAGFALVQTFLLLAHEQSIGTCIKTGLIDQAIVKEIGVEAHELVVCAVAYGKYDYLPEGKQRQPIHHKITTY